MQLVDFVRRRRDVYAGVNRSPGAVNESHLETEEATHRKAMETQVQVHPTTLEMCLPPPHSASNFRRPRVHRVHCQCCNENARATRDRLRVKRDMKEGIVVTLENQYTAGELRGKRERATKLENAP